MVNFNKPYEIEREGQMEFFDNYGIPYNDDASVLVDNTDGVYNGNIFEFKLTINNLNKTLFQAIKYLSKMRIKGESVPATILLVDLNATTVYVYKSEDYRVDIHKVYTGAASKDNEGFVAGKYDQMLDYSDMVQSAHVKKILKGKKVNPDEMYMPIDIDENCIVGWAERYYREKPDASKGDFLGDDTGTAVRVIGEIRAPRHFKGLINSYTGKSNEKFKYLMDKLNSRLAKKDLGAFYTPIAYAKKAAEFVLLAVDRVPDGNDYIILDRCAGTGNLEVALIGLTDRNGDDLIEHCVVSTYEYYEYKVLQERIGDKVRDVIPPTEANVVYEKGNVINADAMSKEYIDNPIIRQYVDNPKCTIILFENPPFRDENSMDGNNHTGKIQSYIRRTMASTLSNNKNTYKDLANQFIWSAFQYYMRQPTDSYVVFSPIKYWKTEHLADKVFLGGYLFNRGEFHAQDSAIACVIWANIKDVVNSIVLPAINISGDTVENVEIRKVFNPLTNHYDRQSDSNDVFDDSVYCDYSGEETTTKKLDAHSRYNDNIIGCLDVPGFSLDPKQRHLTRVITYRGRGFYLRKNTYLVGLPLFVSKYYPVENWYQKDVYATTSDGGDAYKNDPQFLKSCLMYTCLSNQNKCLSFIGSDGRRYQNELCFDDSRIDAPLALSDLKKYASVKATALDDEEKRLLEVWNKIIDEARKTDSYNPDFNYGVYQITKELNTSKTVGTGKSKKTIYDYPELNGYLDTLRTMLKAYYKSHITEKMFTYELLK